MKIREVLKRFKSIMNKKLFIYEKFRVKLQAICVWNGVRKLSVNLTDVPFVCTTDEIHRTKNEQKFFLLLLTTPSDTAREI